MPEILRGRLVQILDQELQVVRQVLANLVLAGLSDITNGLNQLLIHPFHIPSVRVVNLQTNVLDWVFGPELEFVLVYKEQWQSQIIQNRCDMLLA